MASKPKHKPKQTASRNGHGRNGHGSSNGNGRKPARQRKTFEARIKLFADRLIQGDTLEQAYIAVGGSPNGARQCGSRLLSRADVQQELERRMDKAMGGDEIIERLTAMARIDLFDFVTTDGEFKLQEARDRGLGPLAHTFEINESYFKGELSNVNRRLKLHNSMDALKELARIRGLVKSNPAPPAPAFLQVTAVLALLPLEIKRAVVKVLQERRQQAIDVHATEVMNG